MKRLIGTLMILLLAVSSGFATDYYVSTSGNNSNSGTSPGSAWRTITYALQQVSGTVGNPAVIHVAAGTYNRASEGGFPITVPASAGYVTITGAGEGTTIVNGLGAANWVEYYIFDGNGPARFILSDMTLSGGRGGVYLRNSANNVELYDVTITGFDYTGSAPDNPGVRVSDIGGSVILQDVTIESPINDNFSGGGIRASGVAGSLTLTRVSMNTPNALYTNGGAMYATSIGSIQVTDFTATSPVAQQSGGTFYLLNIQGNVTINGLTVTNSAATYDKGGVLYIENVSGGLTVSQLSSTGSSAAQSGGAFYLKSINGGIMLDDIDISDSEALWGSGGAISIESSSGGVTLSDVSVEGSYAGQSGGSIYLTGLSGGVTLSGVDIEDSQAQWANGGGISLTNSTGGVTLSEVTVSDAHTAANGGGIYMHGLQGRLTLEEITVADSDTRENFGGKGGGISITGVSNADSVIVQGLTLTNNASGGDGGGMFLSLQQGGQDIPVSMDDVTVIGNSSGTYGHGGGLYVTQVGAFELTDGIFEQNQTSVPPAGYGQYDGGGVYLYKVDNIEVDNVAFIGNLARGDGGGMYIQDNQGGIELTRVMFLDNVADGASAQESQGGGLHVEKAVEVSISQALFAGNYAAGDGGGIYWDRKNSFAELEITNVTMAFNQSETSGSAIYTDQNSLTTINSSIIWGNGDTSRTAIFTGEESSVSGSSGNDPGNVTYMYSCVETDGGGVVDGTSNTNVNPFYYDPIANNFSVIPGSPVIDAGDPNADYSFETEPNGDRVNMGWGMVISGSSYPETSIPDVEPAPPSASSKVVMKNKYIFMGSPIQPDETDQQHIPLYAWGDNLNNTTPSWELQTWRFSRWTNAAPYGEGQTFAGYLRYMEPEANTGGVDVGDPPPIAPGLGYWFVWNEGAVQNQPAVAVDIHRVMRPAEAFVVELEPWPGGGNPPYGYNMMANPWPFAISWSDVRFSTDQSVWHTPLEAADLGLVSAYAGVWNHEEERHEAYYGRLDPWQGFWVAVLTTDPVYMKFNPFQVDQTAATFKLAELDEAVDWMLMLTARRTDALQVDLDNWIGVGSDLSDGMDKFDALQYAPQASEAVFLRTRLVENGIPTHRLAYDFRENNLSQVDYKSWMMETWFYHDATVPGAGNTYAVDVKIQWPTISQVPEGVQLRIYGWNGLTFNPESDPLLVADLRETPELTLTLNNQFDSHHMYKRFWLVATETPGALDAARENRNGLPLTSQLADVSPNPFNSSALVRFHLAEPSDVTLTVFNTLGQQVATLVRGQYQAGRHTVAWQADGLATGIYFVRMEAQGAGVTQFRKVLLQK